MFERSIEGAKEEERAETEGGLQLREGLVHSIHTQHQTLGSLDLRQSSETEGIGSEKDRL